MITMCLSYYGYLYGSSGRLYLKQLIAWGIFSVIAAFFAKALYQANHEKIRYGLLINYLPLIALGVEFADLWYLFISYRTNFMQLLIDFAGLLILSRLFTRQKETRDRVKLMAAVCLSVAAVCPVFLILWHG